MEDQQDASSSDFSFEEDDEVEKDYWTKDGKDEMLEDDIQRLTPGQPSYSDAHAWSREKKVVRVALYKRQLNIPFGKIPALVGAWHEGLLLRTADGKEYLLERGPGVSEKYKQDVKIRRKPDMKKWTLLKEGKAVGAATINDFLEKAKPDKRYNVLWRNCLGVKKDCKSLIAYLEKDDDDDDDDDDSNVENILGGL